MLVKLLSKVLIASVVLVFSLQASHAQTSVPAGESIYHVQFIPSSYGLVTLTLEGVPSDLKVSAFLPDSVEQFDAYLFSMEGMEWDDRVPFGDPSDLIYTAKQFDVIDLHLDDYGILTYGIDPTSGDAEIIMSTVCNCSAIDHSALFAALGEIVSMYGFVSPSSQVDAVFELFEIYSNQDHVVEECENTDKLLAAICTGSYNGGLGSNGGDTGGTSPNSSAPPGSVLCNCPNSNDIWRECNSGFGSSGECGQHQHGGFSRQQCCADQAMNITLDCMWNC